MAIYIDGMWNTNLAASTGLRASPPNLRLGSLQTGATGKFFSGVLDDVRLYNRLLAPSEIGSLASVAPHPAPIITNPVVNNGIFRFSFSGDPAPYTLQVSSNLMNWTALWTTNPSVLPVMLSLPFSNSVPRQFYRLELGP